MFLTLVAFDAGGYHPVTWNRGLLVAGLALVALPYVRPSLLVGALTALAAWTALSYTWSDSPPAALLESQRVVVYAAVAAVVSGVRVPRVWIVRGVLAALALVCVWDLLTRAAPDWTGQPAQLGDIGGFADPIGYANGVALLAAVGIALSVAERWTAPFAVPFAAVLGLQSSVGADVAAIVACALLAAHAARFVLPAVAAIVAANVAAVANPSRLDVHAAAHAGHLLLLVVIALAAAQAFVPAVRVPWQPMVVAMSFAGHERGHYWHVAWHEFTANPVLGSGAGTFVDWWLRLRTVDLPTQEAHSLYLETLAELGPVGLALVVAALAGGLVAARRAREPAILAAVAAYAVAAAVDFDWELAGVTLPVVVLAAAATAGSSTRHMTWLRPVGAVAALAAALALVGNAAVDGGDGRAATRWAPYRPDAWIALARARARNGDETGAAAAYRHAVRLDRNDYEAWVELASVTSGEPHRSAVAEAVRLDPLGGAKP